jgi:hypothetical protein
MVTAIEQRGTDTARTERCYGAVAAVDPDAHLVELDDGERLAYDALLIAANGVPRAPYRRGLTFGLPGSEERMHGLLQEAAPLERFGPEASGHVAQLLSDAGVRVELGVDTETADLDVERVVTIPVLSGPRIEGLPCDDAGLLPVGADGRVVGTTDVYALLVTQAPRSTPAGRELSRRLTVR